MKEERYADNLRFFRTSEKVFESSEPIYYPDDEVTLRLISYYPYQEEGVNMGESTMSVAVETDQNLSAGYFCSDFLVASQICNQLLKEPSPCTMITNFSN